MTDGRLPPAPNVVEAYATHFTDGMVDLSCPSPSPLVRPTIDVGRIDLEFAVPGGSTVLRRHIAGLYRTLSAEDILVTNGASEALAALAAAFGERRGRIAVAAGAYPSITEVARLSGATLLSEADLEAADVVVLTNPTVPGGQRVDVPGTIARATAAGTVVVVDEVYARLTVDGGAFESSADIDARAVSVGDLSKSLGLGGLRIGWIATRNAAVREAAAKWLRLFTGGPSVLSEAAACDVLAHFNDHLGAHLAAITENAAAVYEALRRAGWTFERAQLGMTVSAAPPYRVSEDALEQLRGHGLFMVRTESFGEAGGFRIGLLTNPAALRTALELLERYSTRERLVVLARIPSLGVGKTRLATSLGAERTFRLAAAFLEDTLRLASSASERPLLACASAGDAVAPLESLCVADVIPQVEGDLGDRIQAALDAALEESDVAVLIGSDTPDLPPAFIERAFAELRQADAVIGPSRDGGFYLLGVRRTHPDMFRGVEWSTATVCARTIASLERLGWDVVELEPWEDVDDLGSLVRLAQRLDADPDELHAPATREAIALMTDAGWP